MSRKDFIALAAALKESRASIDVATAIAQVCSASNGNFNWARFMHAAGH